MHKVDIVPSGVMLHMMDVKNYQCLMAYSDRKRYQLGYGNESPSPALKKHLEGKKMACSNPECFCVDCECDPCLCREDRPCGCDPTVQAVPPKVGRSRPAGRIQNEWKGLI